MPQLFPFQTAHQDAGTRGPISFCQPSVTDYTIIVYIQVQFTSGLRSVEAEDQSESVWQRSKYLKTRLVKKWLHPVRDHLLFMRMSRRCSMGKMEMVLPRVSSFLYFLQALTNMEDQNWFQLVRMCFQLFLRSPFNYLTAVACSCTLPSITGMCQRVLEDL